MVPNPFRIFYYKHSDGRYTRASRKGCKVRRTGKELSDDSAAWALLVVLQQRDRIKELNSSKKTAESERTKLRAILKKIPIEGTVKPEYEAPYNTARDNNKSKWEDTQKVEKDLRKILSKQISMLEKRLKWKYGDLEAKPSCKLSKVKAEDREKARKKRVEEDRISKLLVVLRKELADMDKGGGRYPADLLCDSSFYNLH